MGLALNSSQILHRTILIPSTFFPILIQKGQTIKTEEDRNEENLNPRIAFLLSK